MFSAAGRVLGLACGHSLSHLGCQSGLSFSAGVSFCTQAGCIVLWRHTLTPIPRQGFTTCLSKGKVVAYWGTVHVRVSGAATLSCCHADQLAILEDVNGATHIFCEFHNGATSIQSAFGSPTSAASARSSARALGLAIPVVFI